MSTMLAPTRWLTVNESADRLGVTNGRIRQLILKGMLHGEKFGNSWAIAESEIERFEKLVRKPGNPQFLKKSKRGR